MRALRTKNRPGRGEAFSLVEVALSLGVLAIALVALFALMPSGLTGLRVAMDTSISAQIAQRILDDAQQAEFDELVDRKNLPSDPQRKAYCPERFSFRAPKVESPAWRYFDEEGTEIRPKDPKGRLSPEERILVVYQVNTRIRPRAEIPTLRESRGQVAQLTVQVARNPNLVALEVYENPEIQEHNLLKPANQIPIFTFSGLIGRNQGR